MDRPLAPADMCTESTRKSQLLMEPSPGGGEAHNAHQIDTMHSGDTILRQQELVTQSMFDYILSESGDSSNSLLATSTCSNKDRMHDSTEKMMLVSQSMSDDPVFVDDDDSVDETQVFPHSASALRDKSIIPTTKSRKSSYARLGLLLLTVGVVILYTVTGHHTLGNNQCDTKDSAMTRVTGPKTSCSNYDPSIYHRLTTKATSMLFAKKTTTKPVGEGRWYERILPRRKT